MTPPPPRSTLFPYTTLFRSCEGRARPGLQSLARGEGEIVVRAERNVGPTATPECGIGQRVRREIPLPCLSGRSEEHTSELQSHVNLVCRLLLEKKKKKKK